MSDPELESGMGAAAVGRAIAAAPISDDSPDGVAFHVDLEQFRSTIRSVLLPTRDQAILNKATMLRDEDEARKLVDFDGKLNKVRVSVTDTYCHLVCTSSGVTSEAWVPVTWEESLGLRRNVAFEVQYSRLTRLFDNFDTVVRRRGAIGKRSSYIPNPHARISFSKSEDAIFIQFPQIEKDFIIFSEELGYSLRIKMVNEVSFSRPPNILPNWESNFCPRRLANTLSKVRVATTTTEQQPLTRWVIIESGRIFAGKTALAIRYESDLPIVPQIFAVSVEDANVLRSVLRRCPVPCRIDLGDGEATIEAQRFRCTFTWSPRPVPTLGNTWSCREGEIGYDVSRSDLLYAIGVCQATVGRREGGAQGHAFDLVIADFSDVGADAAGDGIPGWMLERARSKLVQRNEAAAKGRKAIMVGIRGPAGNDMGLYLGRLDHAEDQVLPMHAHIGLTSFEQAVISVSADRLQLVVSPERLLLVAREAEGTVRIVIASAQ